MAIARFDGGAGVASRRPSGAPLAVFMLRVFHAACYGYEPCRLG